MSTNEYDQAKAASEQAGRVAVDDTERARRIRAAVRAASTELRQRHRWLRHQTVIGTGIQLFAVLGVVAVAFAYGHRVIGWWVAIPVAAMFMSLSHEIEHDLIHRQYFPRNTAAQDILFTLGWLVRPNSFSPWLRRPMHLLHHEASGTERDAEETFITNGRRWGPARAVMMIDPLAAVLFRLTAKSEDRRRDVQNMMDALRPIVASVRAEPSRRRRAAAITKLAFPLMVITAVIWYVFLFTAIMHLVDPALVASPRAVRLSEVVNFVTVVWIAPNILRVACLYFIGSNIHYYGDIEDGNVIQQTQVLNRWWLLPLQLFCFDVGATHAIHHFVPGDPFYVRHAIRRDVYPVMRANGVRFNDLGTFGRANRYGARTAGVSTGGRRQPAALAV